MACGMPILASASGETERVINESKCGMCCKIGDENELASAIEKLSKMSLNEMKNNSVKYFEDNFKKDIVIEKLIRYLEKKE